MKFDSIYGGQKFLANIFNVSRDILSGKHTVREYKYRADGTVYDWDYKRPLAGRAWFLREVNKHKLHPAIERVIEGMNYQPRDWQQLLLEWPHVSESDPNRLAYTQDERKGERDIQTVTTIGKYLQRHFVMPDHEIRDVVALYTSTGTMEIRAHMQDIIDAVRKGPTSCMSKGLSIRCDDGVDRHPYAVYNPNLGWSVAVRINGDSIDGRALIYRSSPDLCGYFVRSYKRCPEGGYSNADEMLEAWLKSQGIEKHGDWEGAHVAAYAVNNGYLMPYLDGGVASVSYNSNDRVLVVESGGEYDCDSTEGLTAHTGETCEDCGAHCDEDDMYWVGRSEDQRVCSSCIDSYTHVYGRRGNQYYVANDYAIEVSGDWYDEDYLSDNDIVELADGGYSHIDDATYIESSDEYYDCNDDCICYAEDTGRYELRDDCWRCAESSNYYTNDVDYELIDGETVHPDHAPQETTDTNDTTTN